VNISVVWVYQIDLEWRLKRTHLCSLGTEQLYSVDYDVYYSIYTIISAMYIVLEGVRQR